MSDEIYYHRLKNLVAGLITRTESDNDSDRLQWEAVGEDEYELSLSRNSIRIGSNDKDGRYPFTLSLLDEEGRTVELVEGYNESHDDYRLRDLYTAASRSHRRVNDRLDELFSELNIPDPPPQQPDPWGTDEPPF